MTFSREQWLLMAEAYMRHCYEGASVPRVGEFAAIIGRSREWTTRSFAAAVGRAPATVFRDIQIRRAKALLATTNRSIADVATSAAFGSTRAFYRTFLQCTGLGPTEFRRAAREAKEAAGATS